MSLKIAIIGAKGRMGQTIAAVAAECGCTVTAMLDQGDNLLEGARGAQAIIDFSFHKVTAETIRIAQQLDVPLVIGTTGHPAEEKKVLQAEAAKLRCVWAGNYSVGVNLLFALTRRAAAVLGNDYDAEVLEMHHRFKKDAPSGTAARLLEVILEERKLTPEALRHGREGITGERTKTEVGIHAIRGGDVVGDHTVIFAALGERVELTHKASDRVIFARGALRAAQWLTTQKIGLYDMQHVLGLT
ncbi:4-hydroxy-tetrahydrodipicolinate reductase [Nibricoccus sp. IMCC34717]|uniref:4-hydroxy-tetrahydrodipicolinate reductase n=1 Tax=Nibricoccus sp. IMCC34717 TaxID=3034021 RepID=UPI00384C06E5